MAETRLAVLTIGIFLAVALAISPDDSAAAEFSAEAVALPFPPDARKLVFVAWAGDIKYYSRSPLKSLAAFYLKEMAIRGWEHDESAVEIDKDSIELTFKNGKVKVELDFRQGSKDVSVRLDCKGLKFTGIDAPSKLVAAGIPVSRAALFLEKAIPLPTGAQGLRYDGDGCQLKSSLKLRESFDYFSKLVVAKGFRESRRPIITETRRYTKFKKGSVELSVNIFKDKVGSRIILRYDDQRKETLVPPLAAVVSLPIKNPGTADEPKASEPAIAPIAKKPINVLSNKGSTVVNYGDKKYAFPNVVCFQTKDRGDYATMVVFSAKPIPVNKLQLLVSKEDDPSFHELYELSSPEHLILQLGKYRSLTFSASGVGIGGHSIKTAVGEMKVKAGRVQGTLKMPPKKILSRQFSFTATIDAAILTPNTRVAGPSDPVERSGHPALGDSPVPMPKGAEDISRTGSNFRKTYSAAVAMPLADVASFYRKELAAKGWKRAGTQAAGDPLQFKNDTMDLSVALKRRSGKTAIQIVTRNFALAKREGLLPESGKGRLVLANGHNVGVIFTIGKTDYSLKAGQGAKNPKQALNYSVAPGNYKVIIKIPGKQPLTERVEITAGSTWGIIVLPTGGYLPMRMY
jgi:hypothetical protein